MNKDKKAKIVAVLNEVAKDMERDAEEFDGKPFNGKTVAMYFGCQGAAIAAIAKVLISILEGEEV